MNSAPERNFCAKLACFGMIVTFVKLAHCLEAHL